MVEPYSLNCFIETIHQLHPLLSARPFPAKQILNPSGAASAVPASLPIGAEVMQARICPVPDSAASTAGHEASLLT
jgi:hypothetical protein